MIEFGTQPIINSDLYRPGFDIVVNEQLTSHYISGKTIYVPSMYYYIINLWGPSNQAINACCVYALDQIYNSIDRACKKAGDKLNVRANRTITVPVISAIYSN